MEWHNSGTTTLKHANVPQMLKLAGKPNNYQFYWPNFLKFCGNISHKLLRPSQFLEKIYGNSGMAHFAEINLPPPPYSMLQHIGRVATPKLVPRTCLRYLQTTLIMGDEWFVSKFMWGIVGSLYPPQTTIFIPIEERFHSNLLEITKQQSYKGDNEKFIEN